MLAPGVGTTLASIAPSSPLDLLVGPEGGFDGAELAAAKLAGLTAVSLGPRVLKAETAAVAALSALQALHGDLR